MSTPPQICYMRHRFPPEVIAHSVCFYVRFNLSLREIEEMLLERGIDVSYKTIGRWTIKFEPDLARGLQRRQARPGDVWHLDELRVEIAGRLYWLWRAMHCRWCVGDSIRLHPPTEAEVGRPSGGQVEQGALLVLIGLFLGVRCEINNHLHATLKAARKDVSIDPGKVWAASKRAHMLAVRAERDEHLNSASALRALIGAIGRHTKEWQG